MRAFLPSYDSISHILIPNSKVTLAGYINYLIPRKLELFGQIF